LGESHEAGEHYREHECAHHELAERRQNYQTPDSRSGARGLDESDESRSIDIERIAVLRLKEKVFMQLAEPPADDLAAAKRLELR